ncbi:hypothetical protein [Naasia lichenicola]|uniref:DUF3558 domain-containing protein n=1 Tax=Naasia lichenicola TaxID=2565933 RepID=A0A4S4FQ64_9MICO|nr:hypothetical protein [Naasia lichenicola]THG30735.1 hypothetical protein E6C64_08840 [Naasia lichenicola]THG31972.1 hypothetical protein E6C64_07985 [Naasia lichenicola]
MAVGAAMVALMLAGCSAAAPAPSPTATASMTPTPTPTPSEEPMIDPDPTAIDAIDCEALAASARVSIFGDLAFSGDPSSTAVFDVLSAAAIQAGWADCSWTDGAEDGGQLIIDVLLGGGAAAPANWDEGNATTADSTYDCYDVSVGDTCVGDFVVGVDWVHIEFAIDSDSVDDPSVALLQLAQQSGAYLTTLARVPWVQASTWVLPQSCDGLDPDGSVADAIDAAGVEPSATDQPGGATPSYYYATASQHPLRCSWDDGDPGLSVEMLPGAGWTEPLIVAQPGYTSRSLPMSRGSVLLRTTAEGYTFADVFTSDGWLALHDDHGTLSDEQLAAAADAVLTVISPVVAE